MDYRNLGKSGLKISELGLGAMMFGGRTSEADSVHILNRFVEAGGNFLDTADIYGDGASEEVLGRWLKGQQRDDYVIATKVWGQTGPGPNDRGLSRRHIFTAVEASLRRLGTDHLDLYQAHLWDDSTPLEETLAALDSLVRSGKVRYIGVSNFRGWQLQKAVDLCQRNGWAPISSLQPLYNLLDRSPDWELLPVCANEGIGVITWSPLRSGWLSGAYRRGMTAPPADSKVSTPGTHTWDRYAGERTWKLIDEIEAIAEETGRTMPQVAVNWLLQQEVVTAPIIGPRTPDYLDDLLGAVGWSLSPEHLDRLEQVSRPDPPYPYFLY